MLIQNFAGIAIILVILGLAIRLAPRDVAIAGHDAGQLLLISALPIFFMDFATSAEYAAGQLHLVLAEANLQALAPYAVLIIALLNIAFGSLYLYALGVFHAGGGADAASMRYLGASVAIMVAFLLLGDYIMTIVVSSLSGADQLLSSISAVGATPLAHIAIGIFIAGITFYLTLRGRRDASRVTYVVLFTYAALMGLTFVSLGAQMVSGGDTSQYSNIQAWIHQLQGTGIYGLPKIDPQTLPGTAISVVANSVLHGLVALTGLEAVSNGLNFIRNRDAAYVRWGKQHLPQLKGVWNYYSGRVGVGRTIQTGFLFWGGVTTALNSALANHYNVLDGTYGKTLVGNLAFFGLVPIGGVVLYVFRQCWSALTLSFANMTAYDDMQALGYRDGTTGLLPSWLNYRAPNGNFPRPVSVAFISAVIIIVLVQGDTSTAVPFYGIGVFAPIAFMGFAVSRHLRVTKTNGWRAASIFCFSMGILSSIIFISQIVGKFEEGGWIRLASFILLYVIGHIFLLSRWGERNLKAVPAQIENVLRLHGAMADLQMWQTRMMQAYRTNTRARWAYFQQHQSLQGFVKPVRTPEYDVHDDPLEDYDHGGHDHLMIQPTPTPAPVEPPKTPPVSDTKDAKIPKPTLEQTPTQDSRPPVPVKPSEKQ